MKNNLGTTPSVSIIDCKQLTIIIIPIQLSTAWKDEDIYMVPAKDENTLYEQLRDIRTNDICRKYIKLVSTTMYS